MYTSAHCHCYLHDQQAYGTHIRTLPLLLLPLPRTTDRGNGLITKRDIGAGEFVVAYDGTNTPLQQAIALIKKESEKPPQERNYYWARVGACTHTHGSYRCILCTQHIFTYSPPSILALPTLSYPITYSTLLRTGRGTLSMANIIWLRMPITPTTPKLAVEVLLRKQTRADRHLRQEFQILLGGAFTPRRI